MIRAVHQGHTTAEELLRVAQQAGTVIEELRHVAELAEHQAGAITKSATHALRVGEQIEVTTHQQGSANQQVLEAVTDVSTTAQQNAEVSTIIALTASELERVLHWLNTALSFTDQLEVGEVTSA